MLIRRKIGPPIILILIALAGGGTTAWATSPSALPAGPAAHSAQPLPMALRPVLYQALAKNAGTDYNVNAKGCATLPRAKFTACFNAGGTHFSGAGSLVLHLVGYGRGETLLSVKTVKPVIETNRVSYGYGNLTVWWRVLPIGFEQGFTIAKRPSGKGELMLALAASRQDAGAPNVVAPLIRHSREGGNPVKTILAWGRLRYGELVVTDAKGRVVPATLATKGDRILIAVNDARAAYPLTVDPLVWLEQKVAETDGAQFDAFGYSVAISGSTALVGTPFATVNGNAYQGAV